MIHMSKHGKHESSIFSCLYEPSLKKNKKKRKVEKSKL